MRRHLQGFSLVELLVIVVALTIIAVMLYPMFSGHTHRHAIHTTCTRQLRQLGTALQMYAQDHGHRFLPAGTVGASWDTVLNGYVGSTKMFYCSLDPKSNIATPNSYAYNGLLLRADASGVNEAQVRVPTEVGAFCDAEPTRIFGGGAVIGGGGLLPAATWGASPVNRHNKGLIMGYADGHAKYIPQGVQARDAGNPFVRAFAMAGPLGLVDNPVGGMSGFVMPTTPDPTVLTVGGEPCTRPLLLAAAEAWAHQAGTKYTPKGFRGQYAAGGRSADSVWGVADGQAPAGKSYHIATDAVVVIVNKNCKINWTAYRHTLSIAGQTVNDTYWANSAQIAAMFGAETGRTATAFVGYTYNINSGTRRFFTQGKWWGGTPLMFGKAAITVADDWEMVEKVAADPYGIGYCSAAAADLDRVSILCLQPGSSRRYSAATACCFPTDNPKHRWSWQYGPGKWPLVRTLYAECRGKAWGPNGIADTMFKPHAAGRETMLRGPWYQASYWP